MFSSFGEGGGGGIRDGVVGAVDIGGKSFVRSLCVIIGFSDTDPSEDD